MFERVCKRPHKYRNKTWKLSSMDTLTDRGIMQELKTAPFSFNNVRESGLNDTFGIPLLSTAEITHEEGNVIAKQETFGTSVFNQMSYSGSEHQDKFESLIKNYKDLKNYSEEELRVYNETMIYYQDDKTFQSYLSEYQDENITSEHYFYFKTSTIDSFIRECIISPIQIKSEQVGNIFNKTLIKDFKLENAFEFVRQIYFMEAGEDMSMFCTQLFDKLDQYDK